MSIGFVGLGIMGKGMFKNLISKLQHVETFVVWNRSRAAVDEMISAFPDRRIIAAACPADVVRQSTFTYSMLSTVESSVDVFDSVDGVIAGVSEGKTIIDCATLSPERMSAISDAIIARGGRFLEAPVSGSKVPAETGTLIFLCGGPDDVFADAKVGLTAMGKASFLLGPVGAGSRMKLVVNGLMGTMMSAFTEHMSLCKEAGLSQETLLQVLDLGAMANPMFKGKGPNMIAGKFDAHFPLKHAQKDMRLALAMASSVGLTLPTTEAANAQFESVLEAHGDEDFSALIKVDNRTKHA